MPTNTVRRGYARKAILAYARARGTLTDVREHPAGVLTDLLADLMHWSDAAGLEFVDCLKMAQQYHTEEQ